MTRKPKRKPKPKAPSGVPVRLELDPADRDRLLVAAYNEGRSMASQAKILVLDWLDRVEQKNN
jgi:hypothetical protein